MELFDKLKEWDEVSVKHAHSVRRLIDEMRGKPDLVVIDVGANSGTFFDQLRSGVDVKRAILFEPQVDLYNYLVEKYKDCPEITVENIALSDTVRFYDLDQEAFLHHLHLDRDTTNLGLSKIKYADWAPKQTEFFDNIRHKYNLEKIDIIKIDTETEDLLVLKGFTDTIAQLKEKPLIQVECNWKFRHSFEQAQHLLTTFCEKTGYSQDNIDLNSTDDFYLVPPVKNTVTPETKPVVQPTINTIEGFMKLTNFQVLNALQGFGTLSQNKLPIKLAWKVTTALRSLEPFAKAADESLKEIRLKYAIKKEDGTPKEAIDENGLPLEGTIQIPNDKLAIVNNEVREFMEQEVEVHNVTLKLKDFPESMELEPAVLNNLMPLLED